MASYAVSLSNLPGVYPRDHYEEQMAALGMNGLIPAELCDGSRPVVQALLQRDPAQRSSVRELLDNDWLMKEESD